jgi:hypothetical protein
MTDPVQHAGLLDGLPTTVPALVKVVQGNMLHIFRAERYGVTLTSAQQTAVQIRPLDAPLPSEAELHYDDQIAALTLNASEQFSEMREIFLKKPDWCPPSEMQDALLA